MSKTTNKHQFELMLTAMQAHPDVARGFCKRSKEEVSRIWRNLETELNSAGPPCKSVSEWKKVWSDQKKYVRHKAAQNLKSVKATGGAEKTFSATEEAIYNLIAMQESVEGVATIFGLGLTPTKRALETSTGTREDIVLPELIEDVLDCENQPPEKKQKRSRTELPQQKRSASTEALVEEIKTQKEMCEIMKEQQQNTKEIYRSIDHLYDLKKEELAEQKRHNLVMEKLRLREVEDKIETNRKLVELEERKTEF